MKKISIIIPVYNNQDSLLELISRINLVEKKIIINQIKFEIIVVNDSSLDNSLDVIRDIKKKIRNDNFKRCFLNFTQCCLFFKK